MYLAIAKVTMHNLPVATVLMHAAACIYYGQDYKRKQGLKFVITKILWVYMHMQPSSYMIICIAI